ncbi:MAG: hypothetical protein ACOX5Y_04530 [Acholeplasmataceae bacterium]|jgi:hypothetical protein
MAIIKVLSSNVGVDVSYHRVIGVNINYREKLVNIALASYIDLDKRVQKCRPLEVVDIEVPRDDFDLFLETNPIKTAYEWLKVNVEGFDKAKDDLEKREGEIEDVTTNESE